MFKEELNKSSKRLNWNKHQQVLILERFANYKNLTRELHTYLVELAEDEGFSIFIEDNIDVFDIAGACDWNADTLILNTITFLEKETNIESFKKYINICFHNK